VLSQQPPLQRQQIKLTVDFRKQRREHTPIHINGIAEERVNSFMFLCVHITENLSWTNTTTTIVKAAEEIRHATTNTTAAQSKAA
jgi:hypothetical protein